MGKTIYIGLLGLGTVGSGVVKVLEDNAVLISSRSGAPIKIKRVVMRNPARPRAVPIPPEIISTRPEDVWEDPDIAIVVEAIGGARPAKDYILATLRARKHVVTSNKEVIAKHGAELLEEAIRNNVNLLFEGAVGGGIPIIHPIKECLTGNRIEEVFGIVNGTTNYILSRMMEEGHPFAEVLDEAKANGYAESDPSADIQGYDASYKAVILASLAFEARLQWSDVHFEGISRVMLEDMENAKKMGYTIKLLAIIKRTGAGLEVRVHPTFVPNHHPLAAVSGSNNAIFVRGNAVGELMFYGPGAGSLPTASAVVGDVIDIVRHLPFAGDLLIKNPLVRMEVKPIDEVVSRFYMRLRVPNRPGILGSIATVFGKNEISIEAVTQPESSGESTQLVIIIHQVEEMKVRKAIQSITSSDPDIELASLIRVGF